MQKENVEISEHYMSIASVVKSISKERISTYKQPHLSSNESESLGLYLWNKRLCSLLLPPLQIIEVSLRNAIHDGYIQYQINEGVEEDQIDYLWFKTIAQSIPESKKHVDYAESQLNREQKPLTPDNYIAKLPLGFWVTFCNKKFDVNTQNGLIKLWPSLRSLVFPGAVKGANATPLSIDEISNELKAINSLRNRIAHHETIFNDSNHLLLESAINKVIKSYGRCIKVTKWVNPSNLKLITLLENEADFAQLCLQKEVERFKVIPKALPTADTSHFDSWESNLLVNERMNGYILFSKEHFCLIKSSDTGQKFYCPISWLPGKQALPDGELVNYVPLAPKQAGKNPRAGKIKLGTLK